MYFSISLMKFLFKIPQFICLLKGEVGKHHLKTSFFFATPSYVINQVKHKIKNMRI